MANGSLQEVGVKLVVEGADQSAASFEKNTKAAEGYNAALNQLAQGQAAGSTTAQGAVKAQSELEIAEKQFTQTVIALKQAYDAMEEAMANNQSITKASQDVADLTKKEEELWATLEKLGQSQEQILQSYDAAESKYGKQSSTITELSAALDNLAKKTDTVVVAEKSLNEQIEAQAKAAQEAFALNRGTGSSGSNFIDTNAWGPAQQAQEDYFNSQKQFIAQSNQGLAQQSLNIQEIGIGWQKSFLLLSQFGETPKNALESIVAAQQEGITSTEFYNKVLSDQLQIVLSSIGEDTSWAEVKEKLAQVSRENAAALELENKALAGNDEGHGRVSASAIQSSRAFFALTLASFGLMSITQELKKSFGDDLPQAFEKTSNAVQQIASFGSAGAFIGGGPGAILGGIVGGLVAVSTAALTAEQPIQQLNQALNNMSKQDETIDTLAKVAGVSYEVAKSWDEAAKKSPEFAKSLEEIAKKAEPVPPLLTLIRTVSKELLGDMSALENALRNAGVAAQQLGLFFLGSATGVIKFYNEVTHGINPLKAFRDAQESMLHVMTSLNTASGEAGVSIADQNKLSADALSINADLAGEIDKVAKAENTYSKALQDADFRLAQLNQRTQDQRDANKQTLDNSVADAATARGNAIANADQQWQDKDADLWQSWQDKIAEINSRLTDRVADIQTQLGNKLADIQQSLTDKLLSLQQDLARKLAELAHQREQSIAQANQKEAQAAEDLARKLYEIERTRIEATEALAFNTHEQLLHARTEHDREDILRREQFEKGQIDQKANDDRNNAQNDYATKVKQAEQEKKLAKETYDYQVRLAKELEQEKEADARKSADEQIKQAQRDAAQQTAIAKREQAEALAAAEHRYNEELATAKRSYDEQVAAAKKAEQQRDADAKRSFDQRNAAINKSYELERQQIEKTKTDALKAYEEAEKKLDSLIQKIEDFIAASLVAIGVAVNFARQLAELSLLERYIASQRGVSPIGEGNIPPFIPKVGGYGGLDMTVPEGHTTDSYMIGARTGEHVVITPPGSTSSSDSKTITFNIYDATDPKRVAEVVDKHIKQAVWK